MEFGEMLKQGLNDVPGRGFSHHLKQQVLRKVSQTPRRARRQKTSPWTGRLAPAVAVCLVVMGAIVLYDRPWRTTRANPSAPSQSPLNPKFPASTLPVPVSRQPGIGDTLATLTKEYGTPTKNAHPSTSVALEYDFPNHITAWLRGGRAVQIQELFSGSQSHSAMQVMSLMTPADTNPVSHVSLQSPTENGVSYTYESPTLAKVFPQAADGTAALGMYQIDEVFNGNSSLIRVFLSGSAPFRVNSSSNARSASTLLTFQSEGMPQSESAKLWNSPQGYSLYALNQYTASAEEPGKDVLMFSKNSALMMRVEMLSANADINQAIATAKVQLQAVGNPQQEPASTLQDDFLKTASAYFHASNGTVTETIVLIKLDGVLFQFTLSAPKEAESLTPFYAMMKTIQVSSH